jgi:hypothetical protein
MHGATPLCPDVYTYGISDLNPDKNNTRTPYLRLFTFLQRVSVIPSDCHKYKTQVHNAKVSYGSIIFQYVLVFSAETCCKKVNK